MPPPPRFVAGRYLRRNQAEERALVVLALGLPYWIEEEEGLYHLLVEERHLPRVAPELALYEEERLSNRPPPHAHLPSPLGRKTGWLSLFVYGWVLALFFLIQGQEGRGWVSLGAADSRAILDGQWWRTLTALTLHADLQHLGANIAVGAIFAWALLPWLGVGWTWLGFIASGALGNALNALMYGSTSGHVAIGASTAVFGALGLLVGWQVARLLRREFSRPGRLLVPVAAGFALLAFLGTGEEHARIDLFGHLWGMVAGVGLGLLLGWTHVAGATSVALQRVLAWFALLLPWLAWGVALARQ